MAGLMEGQGSEIRLGQGFEDNRFELKDPISPSFHCPICMNVLNKPVMCRNNQHYFCKACITKHLTNVTHNCPTCHDELTEETLVEAPRIVVEYLSELRIRCDFFSRGCRDVMKLSDLESHVSMCGFAAVKCSNEGCEVIINRQDKLHHEAEVCEFRRLQCHDCVELKTEVKNINKKITEDNAKLQKQVDDHNTKLQKQVNELSEKMTKDNAQLQKQVNEFGEKMTEDNVKLQKQINDHNTKLQKQINDHNTKLKKQINDHNTKLQKQVDELSEKMSRMCEMQTEVMMKVTQMMTKEKQMKQMIPGQQRKSIIIAGGFNGEDHINSVEMFSWEHKTWTLLNPMLTYHSYASAVTYQGEVIISGGSNGKRSTNTIETSSCDASVEWKISPVKLPKLCNSHAAVMYKDSLILSGGRLGGTTSDKIYEISMVPPYSTKILTTMPKPRYDHTIELFEDKLFIFGGHCGNKQHDTVMMFNLVTKEWKMMTPLPFAVDEMASVLWQNNVIVLGGRPGKDTVVMYNLTTGESKYLPSMKHGRHACAAVVTGDVLVVMGGCNRDYLKSAEAFHLQKQVWEELPDMNKARQYASAVVKPN